MRRAGIVGNPISHSKSPRLHNHWLSILGINGQYHRIHADIGGFEQKIAELRDQGFLGINVTIPFKSEACDLADQKSDFVKKNGASNTLIFNDQIEAHNTDGYGFGKSILDQYPDWNVSGDHIVLGAGGAAQAIIGWLVNSGANSITIINRNLEKARKLSSLDDCIFVDHWENLENILDGKHTLINSTSLGMKGVNDIDIDLSRAPKDLIVNDIVYTPLETGLLKSAKAHGLRTVDGLGMLLWQARPGFRRWFGQEPPKIDQGLRNFMLSDQVIALTGSIGAGKTTVAQIFEEFGFDIWEADREVSKLYENDADLHDFIRGYTPDAFNPDFDKSVWRDFVFSHPEIFEELENLIHRKISGSRRKFLESESSLKLCDIPLLFETGIEHMFDRTIAVFASEDVRRARVMERGTMSEAQFESILKKQMPDKEKMARADIVIDNDGDLLNTRVQIIEIMKNLGVDHA